MFQLPYGVSRCHGQKSLKLYYFLSTPCELMTPDPKNLLGRLRPGLPLPACSSLEFSRTLIHPSLPCSARWGWCRARIFLDGFILCC